MFKYRYTCINILSYDVKSCRWSFNNYSIKKSFLDLMHFQKRKIADCGSKLKVLRLLIDLLFNSSKCISLTFVIEILHWQSNGVIRFRTLPCNVYERWLLHESKWKHLLYQHIWIHTYTEYNIKQSVTRKQNIKFFDSLVHVTQIP